MDEITKDQEIQLIEHQTEIKRQQKEIADLEKTILRMSSVSGLSTSILELSNFLQENHTLIDPQNGVEKSYRRDDFIDLISIKALHKLRVQHQKLEDIAKVLFVISELLKVAKSTFNANQDIHLTHFVRDSFNDVMIAMIEDKIASFNSSFHDVEF